MRAILTYNRANGMPGLRTYVYRAAQILRAAGWQVRVAVVPSGERVTELSRRAAGDGLNAVFVVGGDGLAGQAAAGLMGSDTALGVLPVGTASVLSHELGLCSLEWYRPGALEQSAAQLASASIHPVDMGSCNGIPFLLWAGMGLDGLTIRQVEPRMRVAKYIPAPHYFVETAAQASGWNGAGIKVRAEGFAWSGHVVQMVATNIRRYMGGLTELSPNAAMDDGLLDFWLLSGSNLMDSLRHALGMMYGLHLTSSDAYNFRSRKIVIEADSPLAIQLDGEPAGEALRIEIQNLPAALKIILPEKVRKLLKNG